MAAPDFKVAPTLNGAPLGRWGFPYSFDPGEPRSTDQRTMTASNDCLYFRVREGGSITKVALEVITSSGNISVAVYDTTGTGRSAQPSTRLGTSGAVACPAIGYSEVSLGATVVVPDGGWLALSADNATASFRSLIAGAVTNGMGNGRNYRQTTAHPCPSPVGTLAAVSGYGIVLVGVA